MRRAGPRLPAHPLRRLRPRPPRRLLVQGPRLLPVLWRSPHGRYRRPSRRSGAARGADPTVGAPLPYPLRYRCAWNARLTSEVLRCFLGLRRLLPRASSPGSLPRSPKAIGIGKARSRKGYPESDGGTSGRGSAGKLEFVPERPRSGPVYGTVLGGVIENAAYSSYPQTHMSLHFGLLIGAKTFRRSATKSDCLILLSVPMRARLVSTPSERGTALVHSTATHKSQRSGSLMRSS